MRPFVETHPPARSGAAWALLLVLALFGVAAGSPALGQPAAPPAPPEVEPPEVEAPATPEPRILPDAALEQIDRALEQVEERIDEGVEAAESARDGAVLRERRERIREIREQVQRRRREHVDRSDNKVAFGSRIHIAEGEVARDVIAIGGPVDIEGDADGDVVAVGGHVTIDGRVTGDVVAVGGGVELGDDAEVLGEVTSVGGRIDRAPGAEVMGRLNEVALGPSLTWNVGDTDFRGFNWRGRHGFSPFRFGWLGFGLALVGVVVLILLTSLIRLLASGTVERVRATAVESPWLSSLVGLAIELFFLPVLLVVCVILAISIIGIPLLLLIPFVVLAFLLALVVGYSGAAQAVGEWIGGRFGRTAASPFAALLVGVLVIQSLHVAAELFDAFDGFLWFFALMFGVVGFLVRYAAWTVGLGAVFLVAVRRRGGAAPPPPPPPAGPEGPDRRYDPAEAPESIALPEAPEADQGWSDRALGDPDRES